MNKVTIMSIQPKWLAKILNGEKTIEIRKTMPKCELPIDVYLYCTKTNKKGWCMVGINGNETYYQKYDRNAVYSPDHNYSGNGEVVAKFTLNKVDEIAYERLDNGVGYNHFFYCEDDFDLLKNSCLDEFDLLTYLNPKKDNGNICGYAWHIDNLVIFDKLKELSEFYKSNIPYVAEKEIKHAIEINDIKALNSYKITKAPQSWQYAYVIGKTKE